MKKKDKKKKIRIKEVSGVSSPKNIQIKYYNDRKWFENTRVKKNISSEQNTRTMKARLARNK